MAIKDFPTTTKFHETDNFHPVPHSGVDYAMPLYSPVEALGDGVIIAVATNDMLGNHIRLKTNDGKIIVYGHISVFNVEVNQKVKKGDVIALSGGRPGMQGAGHSTGDHLHLSIYNSQGVLIDPSSVIGYGKFEEPSSSLAFPIILILMFVLMWKFKKIFIYGLGIIVVLGVIFIAS